VKQVVHIQISTLANSVVQLTTALRNNDIDSFCTVLQQFFAAIPYDIQIPLERYYQSIFYVIMHLIGVYIHTEVKTNIGRIDAVMETRTHLYIIEFKIDSTGIEALKQIEEKKYYERYHAQNKEVVLIGVSFDSKLRNIAPDWAIKTLN
jgi:hypothetical protein